MKWNIVFLCLISAVSVRADTLNLGTLSYDTFIPGGDGSVGIDAFDISNLTGDFNLPPDFPVLDNLVFQSAVLTLSDGEVFDLGDIDPGFLLDENGNPIVQVPDDDTFQSAEFTATLSETMIGVPGGPFTADSDEIDILLLPSQGPNLIADVDATTITVSNEVPSSTPEPGTWCMALPFAAWVAWRLRRRSFSSLAGEKHQ